MLLGETGLNGGYSLRISADVLNGGLNGGYPLCICSCQNVYTHYVMVLVQVNPMLGLRGCRLGYVCMHVYLKASMYVFGFRAYIL